MAQFGSRVIGIPSLRHQALNATYTLQGIVTPREGLHTQQADFWAIKQQPAGDTISLSLQLFGIRQFVHSRVVRSSRDLISTDECES